MKNFFGFSLSFPLFVFVVLNAATAMAATDPVYGTVPASQPPGAQHYIPSEPPPLPSVPASGVDRSNAVSTARAVLSAYGARDLTQLADLSSAYNRGLMREMARQGAAHPRYRPVFSGWRWKAVSAWDGEIRAVRYRNFAGGQVLPPRTLAWVLFARVEGSDEVIVVTLIREAGQWCFQDIHSPDEADFMAADTAPMEIVAIPPDSTPEAAVLQFFAGAAAKDVVLLRKSIAASAPEELLEITRLTPGDPALDDLQASFGNGRVTGSERSRDPDRATVHILFMRGGREAEEHMQMVREGGQWKIQDF